MKKRVLSLLLMLLLVAGLPVCTFAANNTAFVYDTADLLTASEEAALAQTLEQVSRTYEAQLIVTTVPTVTGGDVDWFLEHWYDSNAFGYGDARNGVLLLVCMDPREYRILSNGYPGEAIDSGVIEKIGDEIVSDLSDGDYAEAFDTFADQCAYYLDGYRNGFPFPFGKNLLICLGIGVVVGLIVSLVLKGQLKSVRKQDAANSYVRDGSMNLIAHHDFYLYSTVSRTKKQSGNNSSGSSGSSRSTGGGSF